MTSNAAICLQWKDAAGHWRTFEISGIPVARAVKIRIDRNVLGLAASVENQLVAALRQLSIRVGGSIADESTETDLVTVQPGETLLEVIVSDGSSPTVMEPRFVEALRAPRNAWVLPIMPASGQPATLPPQLQKQNIAFWTTSLNEVALNVLGRAGVTSLDRRVFISYRRAETALIAGQLFDELTKRNFSVFLDTVSIEPGVDFQERLFEQLADKSMVVLLHSRDFSNSRWTMAEVEYARLHDLTLMILRMPDVSPGDPLTRRSRVGDVTIIGQGDLDPSKVDKCLTLGALQTLLPKLTEVHDLSMIDRLASLRQRSKAALIRNSVRFSESLTSSAIAAQSDTGACYMLFPTSRPPGVPELYDASICNVPANKRVVVGRFASYNPLRISHLDWTVAGRNVHYVDVSQLDILARRIRADDI